MEVFRPLSGGEHLAAIGEKECGLDGTTLDVVRLMPEPGGRESVTAALEFVKQ